MTILYTGRNYAGSILETVHVLAEPDPDGGDEGFRIWHFDFRSEFRKYRRRLRLSRRLYASPDSARADYDGGMVLWGDWNLWPL